MSHLNTIVRFCAIALLAMSAAAFGSNGAATTPQQSVASTPSGSKPISIDSHISGYMVALG